MGLPDYQIQHHIDKWREQLKSIPSRSYRAKWPKYLFRHEPLENAVQLIMSQQLLARGDANQIDHVDIAAPNVLSSRTDAHSFARLYFRPLNPTQYSVEGIRKEADLWDKSNPKIHAPILIMFLFSTSSVLSMPSTNFSKGNMQGLNTEYGSTLEFFESISFEHVFHEGTFQVGTIEGSKILKARCAEVLTESPLDLESHLLGIRCRSEAERQTLLYLCGEKISVNIKSKIKVYSEVGLFQSRYTYVKSVDLSSQGLKITLNPRFDSQDVIANLEITNTLTGVRICRVKPTTIDPAKTQRVIKEIPDGSYLVTIWLENHLAYQAISTVDNFPF